jgi:hypothetical protein
MRRCAGKRIDPEARGIVCAVKRAAVIGATDQRTTSAPADEGAWDRAARRDQRDGEQAWQDAQDRGSPGGRGEPRLRRQPAAAQAHRGSFCWTKTVGGLTQVRVRGLDKVRAAFAFAMAAYDIVRLPKLLAPKGEVRPAT